MLITIDTLLKSIINRRPRQKITINSKKKAISPYAVAKLKSLKLVKKYRKIYNLKVYNGVIFNCESYLRPNHFIIPKICYSAIESKKNL